MGVLSTGVSGGVAVTGQYTGVPLILVNDYGYIIPATSAPTQGPDTQGVLTVVPGASSYTTGAVVAFEKCVSISDFNANNWTPLFGVLLRSTGIGILNGGYTNTMTPAQSMDFALPNVQGLYAVRLRLVTAPGSGSLVVSGQTYPASTGVLNPAVAAYYQQVTLGMAGFLLWASNQDNTDYLSAVGGSY